jgi:hypothetical protein
MWFLLPNHLHQPYWLIPPVWELVTIHTLPCVKPLLVQLAFFLVYWSLKMGLISFPETSAGNSHHSLHNNVEECSSFCIYSCTMLLLLIQFFHTVPSDKCGTYLPLQCNYFCVAEDTISGWMTKESGFCCLEGIKEFFLLYRIQFGPGHTHLCILWVPGAISTGIKWPRVSSWRHTFVSFQG